MPDLMDLVGRINGKNQSGISLWDYNYQVAPNIIEGGYLGVDGSFTANAAYFVSAPILVSEGDVVRVQVTNNLAQIGIIGAAYNGAAFHSRILLTYGKYTIPSGVTSLRINCYVGYHPRVYKLSNGSTLFYTQKSKVSFVGDSITFGYGATKPYPTTISERFGINTQNLGISGSTISSNALGSNPICNRLSAIHKDADYIVLFAGINDFLRGIPVGTNADSVTTTFYGAIKSVCNELKTKNKYATKLICTPLKTTWTPDTGSETWSSYVTALKWAADTYGFRVIDLSVLSLVDPTDSLSTYGGDGLHPSQDGYDQLAAEIAFYLT